MIGFADSRDIPDIMAFIDSHWKKGHILSYDNELFAFQYVWDEEVAFVLSRDESGFVNGILGYIPYGKNERVVALAIWRALKAGDSMLGVKLLEFLLADKSVEAIVAPGISPQSKPIYSFLGIDTGVMRHWYRLNSTSKVFSIAQLSDKRIPAASRCFDACVSQFDEAEELSRFLEVARPFVRKEHPKKETGYILRRYLSHPVYEYRAYGIKRNGSALLVIARVQPCNGSNAFRIVDLIGDLELFPCFTNVLDELLEDLSCEYADIYETGVPESIMVQGGWLDVESTGNVIPEYFSPFELRNVDIHYMSTIPEVVLFKGDGDMDRPN